MNLILVHGALGASAQLEPLRAQLAATGLEASALELEGHGDTPLSGDRYSIGAFGRNIARHMDEARVERAIIFGYSMGGYAAIGLAAELPERVRAVVTLGTKLAWSPELAAKETARLDPATIRAKVPKFASQLEARHGGAGGWEMVLGRTARLMTELGASPVVDHQMLTGITQPVRFMVGDRDALVSIDETAAAANAAPKGEVAVLPNTPHPIEQVRLPMLSALISEFVAAVSTA